MSATSPATALTVPSPPDDGNGFAGLDEWLEFALEAVADSYEFFYGDIGGSAFLT